MTNNVFRICILLSVFVLPACLKTRAEVSDTDQKAVYGKKNVENQMDVRGLPHPMFIRLARRT